MECYPRIPHDAFSKQEGHNGHVERHEKSKREVPFRQSPFLQNWNSHASISRFDLKQQWGLLWLLHSHLLGGNADHFFGTDRK